MSEKEKPHRIDATADAGWIDVAVTCPYPPADKTKPCRVFEDEAKEVISKECGLRHYVEAAGMEAVVVVPDGPHVFPLVGTFTWDGDGPILTLQGDAPS